MTFDPYIPLALWLPLTVAAAALLAAYAVSSRRRLYGARYVRVLALMALAVTLPLVILLNPTWVERVPPPAGKPLLTVLVDASASMAIRDVAGGSRFAGAADIARRAARELDDRFEVRLQAFSESSSPVPLEELGRRQPEGPATDLAAAIEQSLEDRPQGQSLLLLSDGAHNVGPPAQVRGSLDKARALAAPIYTKTFGGASGVRDLEVRLNLPQELAFVDQQVPVTVTLQQRGRFVDRTRLSLLLDGQIVSQQDVNLVPDGSVEATLPVSRSKRGLYRFEFRADVAPQEVTGVNNVATLLLRVVDEPVRVLLLEGKPYWDTKFLVRTLAADESIELTSVVRLTDSRFLQRKVSHPRPGQGDQTPASPDAASPPATTTDTASLRGEQWTIDSDAGRLLANPETLAGYQIVVLGRDGEVYLSDEAVARLKTWLVEGDGSLVCFRGPPASQLSQRLGDLMPVRWSPVRESRFRVELTESGQALRWLPSGGDEATLANLPSLAAVAQPERPKPLAVVLATTSGAADRRDPVISFQPVGSGRVVVVEGAGMWRWAILPPQHQQHDAVYGLLWRSLVRWLVSNAGLLPSQKLALRSDKVTFGTGETATGTLLVRDVSGGQAPLVELTGGTLRQPQPIAPVPAGGTPGQFRVVFGKLPEGRYEARVAGTDPADPTCRTGFDVRGMLKERLEVAARPDVMKTIADQTGGASLDEADPRELAQRFDKHLATTLPVRTVRTTAWDRWWVLVALVAAWAAAWGTRRSSGLV